MYRNARDGRSAAKNWQARSFDQIAVYIYIILSTDSQKPEAEARSRSRKATALRTENLHFSRFWVGEGEVGKKKLKVSATALRAENLHFSRFWVGDEEGSGMG